MAHGHVLEEGVDPATGDGAPGTVQVRPRLCLLQGVVAIEEVEGDFGGRGRHATIAALSHG